MTSHNLSFSGLYLLIWYLVSQMINSIFYKYDGNSWRFGRRNQCSLKNKAYSIKYLNLDTSHERAVVLFELLTGSERKKCRPGHAARGRGGRSSSGRTRRTGWGRCGRCRSLKWKRMIWAEKAIGRSWCYCSLSKDCPGGAGVGGQTWDFWGFRFYIFSQKAVP